MRQRILTQAASCPQCGALNKKPPKMGFGGALAVITLIVVFVGIASLPNKDHNPPNPPDQNPPNPPNQNAPKPSNQGASAKANNDADLDLTRNKKFLAENPKYLDAIRTLITGSGYECPRLSNLWLEGTSPLGNKLEALCGPRGSTNANTALHYTVYPDRLKVDVCKPFGIFGGGCE